MCIVCFEYQKDRMTKIEAIKAFKEMVVFPSPSSSKEDQDHFRQEMDRLSEEDSIDLVSHYDLIRLEGEGG